MIRRSLKNIFFLDEILLKQSRIHSTNGFPFFQCVSRCKKSVMPDLFHPIVIISERDFILSQKELIIHLAFRDFNTFIFISSLTSLGLITF